MKRYIAYFDFLGYKQFILNNEQEYIRTRILQILRDIEAALGQGEYKEAKHGIIADISKSNLHCLNISDTIILWTKDDSFESFQEILNVSFTFNWRQVRLNFPIRGALVYDEIDLISHYNETDKGSSYNINSIFGKGLVNAHLKAECLDLAGCVIDSSIIEKIKEFEGWEDVVNKFASCYDVPYKDSKTVYEYILRLYSNETINEEVFNNTKPDIVGAFSCDNKGMSPRAQQILDNTLIFLESFVR